MSLDGNALHLRNGLLSRNEKVIPRERISSLDTTQGPLQRVFGVLELRVQTPGGGRHAEIVLRAVSRRDAETLRRALGHAAEAAPTPDARLRLAPGTLLVAALTAPQLGVLLPVAGGIAAAGQDVMGNVSRQTFDGLPDTVGQWLLVGAGVIVFAWLLSIAGAVVTFAGFEVVRDGDRLRTRSGLFARRAATLPASAACRACAWSRGFCASRSGSPPSGSRPRATPARAPSRRRCSRSCAGATPPR